MTGIEGRKTGIFASSLHIIVMFWKKTKENATQTGGRKMWHQRSPGDSVLITAKHDCPGGLVSREDIY